MRVYVTGPCTKGQTTGCTATVEGEHPMFGPKVCGWPADGPHPDPAIGYLMPLCAWHRDQLPVTKPDDLDSVPDR